MCRHRHAPRRIFAARQGVWRRGGRALRSHMRKGVPAATAHTDSRGAFLSAKMSDGLQNRAAGRCLSVAYCATAQCRQACCDIRKPYLRRSFSGALEFGDLKPANALPAVFPEILRQRRNSDISDRAVAPGPVRSMRFRVFSAGSLRISDLVPGSGNAPLERTENSLELRILSLASGP